MIEIAQNVAHFVEGRGKSRGRRPSERYASFDYCFNYFQSFRERKIVRKLESPRYLELSCLQLGFYLASWGMLRGSSFLLEKSAPFYRRLISGIATFDKRIWTIDADEYHDENIALLLACREMILESIGREYNSSDTLVTKIMLGVFGNVPAFDDYVRRGLGIYSFNKNSLSLVSEFYKTHKNEIDAQVIYSFDLATGQPTHRRYTKAKIIDMVAFIEGINRKQAANKKKVRRSTR